MTTNRSGRGRQNGRFHAELDAFSNWVNREVERLGPPPTESFRVVAVNKGFELQLPSATTRGWEWKREAWSSTRADLAERAKLRGITI